MDLKNKSKSLALWFRELLKTTTDYATLLYQDLHPKKKIGMTGIVTNWGSKWDVTDMFVEYEDDINLNLSFATAWSPITPIFDELVKRGLSVKAEYQDEGYMFAGEYEDGEVTDFEIKVCEPCQELDEPNYECKCEGNGVIILR